MCLLLCYICTHTQPITKIVKTLVTGASVLSQGDLLCVTDDLDPSVTVPLWTVNNDDVIGILCGITLRDVMQPISSVPAKYVKTKRRINESNNKQIQEILYIVTNLMYTPRTLLSHVFHQICLFVLAK